jgi:hypothetical protein
LTWSFLFYNDRKNIKESPPQNVAKLKYFGTKVNNRYYFHYVIKRRLLVIMGMRATISFRIIRLPVYAKYLNLTKYMVSILLLIIQYGSETWFISLGTVCAVGSACLREEIERERKEGRKEGTRDS